MPTPAVQVVAINDPFIENDYIAYVSKTLLYFLLRDADSKTECAHSQEDTHTMLVARTCFDCWTASCRYMFKYDSTHGVFKGDIKGGNEGLFINGKKIASYSKM